MSAVADAVLVPALRAAIFGSIATIGVFSFLGTGVIHVEKPLAWSGVIGAGVAWLAFALELDKAVRYLDKLVEPKKELDTVRVIVTSQNGKEGTYLDFPFSQEKFEAAMKILRKQKEFSMSMFRGVLSRKEFEEMREILLKRNLARWKNPDARGQGLILTHPNIDIVYRTSRAGNLDARARAHAEEAE